MYNKIESTYNRILGIGDWGLGIGDWGLGPIPNPHFLKVKNLFFSNNNFERKYLY